MNNDLTGDHSDVVFYIKPSNSTSGKVRKLYAIKKILSMRSEYFAAMFDGWNEENSDLEVSDDEDLHRDATVDDLSDVESEVGGMTDEEEEGMDLEGTEADEEAGHETFVQATTTGDAPETNPLPEEASDIKPDDVQMEPADDSQLSRQSSVSSMDNAVTPLTSPIRPSRHPTTSNANSPRQSKRRAFRSAASQRKAKVVITDASYKTFKALLYYLYTDTVVFAPLTSSFLAAREAAALKKQPFPHTNKRDWFVASNPGAWPTGVEALVKADSNRILLTSAKETYTIADKLNLVDLKARAGVHIQRSLTVATIPLEVFSPFTTVRFVCAHSWLAS
jgi:hypothetical protein